MATFQELMKARAELDAQIEMARNTELADAKAKIHALMAEYGLTVADLVTKQGKATPRAPGKPTGKVAAKFRDPATGSTWSGRGLKPNWLKAKIEEGNKLEDFAVS